MSHECGPDRWKGMVANGKFIAGLFYNLTEGRVMNVADSTEEMMLHLIV